MSYRFGLVSFVCIIWSCVGCGVNPNSPGPPKGDACTGLVITGTLQDSLTSTPVQQGRAFLESGTQVSGTRLYTFSATQQASTDVNGNFRFCSSSVPSRSVVVAVALDSSNNAYPSFVAPVSGPTYLGTIPMGGCREKCGFEGQLQTSSPATIKGMVTTTPIAKTVSVVPQFPMKALDGTTDIWSVAIPPLNISQPFSFATAGVNCTGQVPFCAPYTFLLPSQKPVWAVKGGYLQEAGAPVYAIYASVPGTLSCIPSSLLTFFQQDGTSPFIGVPGSQLSAATINFSACQ